MIIPRIVVIAALAAASWLALILIAETAYTLAKAILPWH